LNKGKLYLIPTVIAENSHKETLTNPIKKAIQEIDIFIVENIKSARRNIKKIYKEKNIDNVMFLLNGKHNKINLQKDFLEKILLNKNIGLLSDAGMPCIADPGAEIVSYAHEFQIDVIPLVGPSSIFLALMSSGFNGQNFSFNGYLPIDKSKRIEQLKYFEKIILSKKQTQIFIETPYRNNQLFESILQTCSNKIKLCIACDLTSTNQYIKTKYLYEWKSKKPKLEKKPTIFVLGNNT
jgi:16S rRNA (cytidine1402-2'-O)-methyltransferase